MARKTCFTKRHPKPFGRRSVSAVERRDSSSPRLESRRRNGFEVALNQPSQNDNIRQTPNLPVSETYATFIERLYRNDHSYADRLSEEELDLIHIDLGVETFVLDQAERDRQIVVTGNPGDGKTHLIERLRPQLEQMGATVITDANAMSDVQVLEAWERCASDKSALVLAINEWPLYVLQRTATTRQFLPVEEAIRQVTLAQYFLPEDRPESAKQGVIVVDLGLRNVLTVEIVEKVINRLTDARFYGGLNPADPVIRNRAALCDPQVSRRMAIMLASVGLRIPHVTMRQLLAFIAYTLTGGRPADQRIADGQDEFKFKYSTLAFEGGIGPLFDGVREVFDPAKITIPELDSQIWFGTSDESDWKFGRPPEISHLYGSNQDWSFRAAKRQFFFEHASGRQTDRLRPNGRN